MQRSERDAEWFRYRPGSRLASNLLRLAVLVVYAGVPVLLCAFSLSPYAWLRTVFLLSLPLLFFGGIPLTAALISSADISLTPDGVRLHVVGPWVIRIPWDALRYSTIIEMPAPAHTRLTLARAWDSLHTVHVPGMNVLKTVGIYYGLGQMPVFAVTPDHEHRDRLLQRLRHGQHPLRRAPERSRRPWRSPNRDLD